VHRIAARGRFVTVKLQQRLRHGLHRRVDQVLTGVDKQAHRHHEGRQAAGQFGRPVHAEGPRALVVQHKADGVGAGGHGGVHVGLAGEAADLDSGALGLHGSQPMAGVWVGRFNAAS